MLKLHVLSCCVFYIDARRTQFKIDKNFATYINSQTQPITLVYENIEKNEGKKQTSSH